MVSTFVQDDADAFYCFPDPLLTMTLSRRSSTTSKSPTTVSEIPSDHDEQAVLQHDHGETDQLSPDFRKDWQRRVRCHFDQVR